MMNGDEMMNNESTLHVKEKTEKSAQLAYACVEIILLHSCDLRVALLLAGFPRIPFLHSQASDNDTQLWLTPAVVCVCIPWLLFKAFLEARLKIVALYFNEDQNVDTTEFVIF